MAIRSPAAGSAGGLAILVASTLVAWAPAVSAQTLTATLIAAVTDAQERSATHESGRSLPL